MKKLFISVPMKDRTDEAIKASMEKMHKIAETTVGEKLEVIPSFIEDEPPKDTNMAIWYLGKSIQLLAEADYIVIVDVHYNYKGCAIENEVARYYDIPTIVTQVDFIAPDVYQEMFCEIKDKSCEV